MNSVGTQNDVVYTGRICFLDKAHSYFLMFRVGWALKGWRGWEGVMQIHHLYLQLVLIADVPKEFTRAHKGYSTIKNKI